MQNHHTHIKMLSATLVAAATIGVGVGVSRAESPIVERVVDHPYAFGFEGRCDFGTDDPSDDISVIESYSGVETYTVKVKPDGAVLFQGHFEEDATFLNPATDRSFTTHRVAFEHDVKVLSIDRATNRATVLTSRHDTLAIYSDHGVVDARKSTLSQFTLIVDLSTMDVTFGQFVRQNGATRDGDFCDDMRRFTVA